jgi:hypothetical protein
MTLYTKVMLTIVAVLVIGTVGPFLMMKTGGGSVGIHVHSWP